MRVLLSPEAEVDLEGIADFIALDNADRAQSFVMELVGSARELGIFPERFPLVPRLSHLGIRRRRHASYLILYRLEEARVVVLRILHAHRNYERLLDPQA